MLQYRSKEQYTAFITPEAFDTLQEYGRIWAESMGRPARAKDPIFTATRAGMLVRVSHMTMLKRVRQMVDGAGLHQEKNGKRFHAPLMNGFRRFFNKSCKGATSGDSAISSLIKKEYMMQKAEMCSLTPRCQA